MCELDSLVCRLVCFYMFLEKRQPVKRKNNREKNKKENENRRVTRRE